MVGVLKQETNVPEELNMAWSVVAWPLVLVYSCKMHSMLGSDSVDQQTPRCLVTAPLMNSNQFTDSFKNDMHVPMQTVKAKL